MSFLIKKKYYFIDVNCLCSFSRFHIYIILYRILIVKNEKLLQGDDIKIFFINSSTYQEDLLANKKILFNFNIRYIIQLT